MEQQVSIYTLIISVFTSFLGSLLLIWYTRGRAKRIQARIEELKFEEEYLDRIKKGNIELIRSSFRTVFAILFLLISSICALLSTSIIQFPELIEINIKFLSFAILAGAAGISFQHFNTLKSLNNVTEAKDKLAKKREKLKEKL